MSQWNKGKYHSPDSVRNLGYYINSMTCFKNKNQDPIAKVEQWLFK